MQVEAIDKLAIETPYRRILPSAVQIVSAPIAPAQLAKVQLLVVAECTVADADAVIVEGAVAIGVVCEVFEPGAVAVVTSSFTDPEDDHIHKGAEGSRCSAS